MLTFTVEDEKDVDPSRMVNDSVVIFVKIMECEIKRVLVDIDNSADILFLNVLDELDLDWTQLKSRPKLVISFTGHSAKVEGTISILMMVGEKIGPQTIVMIEFLVINKSSAYNIIDFLWMS